MWEPDLTPCGHLHRSELAQALPAVSSPEIGCHNKHNNTTFVVSVGFSSTLPDVRTAVYDTVTSTDPEELLTTGEAAAPLSSTRQHVVDLCERSDLPFTLVGRHRRVRRGDIDAIRTRSERLTRDQRRSLWLAYATVGKIVANPDKAMTLARTNLDLMRAQSRGETRRWLEEWQRLVDGPLDRLLELYTSRSLRGRELRQNAPFAGLLSDRERQRVLASWRGSGGA